MLGTTELVVDGAVLALSPTRARLVAALVLGGTRGFDADQLIAWVWPSPPPTTVRQSLANQLSWLRTQLPPAALVSHQGSYRIDPDRCTVDVVAFERAADGARRHAQDRDTGRALELAVTGLGWWRGHRAYEALDGTAATNGLRDALIRARRRLMAREADLADLRAQLLLDRGELDAAVEVLESLVAASPERDVRWRNLLLALTRSGRRVDALAVYRRAYHYFTEQLGLEVPEELRELERRVLQSDADAARRRSGGDDPVRATVRRTALLRQLTRLLDTSGIVVLAGEAGIGKTTLTAQLAAWSEVPGRLVRLTCVSNPWSALQPVADLLRELREPLLALRPPPGPAVRHLLARTAPGSPTASSADDPATDDAVSTPALTGDAPASADVGLLTEDVVDALSRVAVATGGLTIVVDDAHRAGPTTHRLLAAATERGPGIRVVAVTRDADLLPQTLRTSGRMLVVPPLDRDELRRVVAPLLPADGDDADDRFGTWLTERTGGNPLFATTLVRELRDRGVLVRDPSGRLRIPNRLVAPSGVRDAVATTLDGLSLATRRALDVLAVLDRPTGDTELADLVDPTPLAHAHAAGVLHADEAGRHAFRHELVRLVAYELIPAGRRTELHHTVATALRDRGAEPEEVVPHALAAVELDPHGAVRALEQAAQRAVQVFAFEEAARRYGQAADVVAAELEPGEGTGPHEVALRVAGAEAARLGALPGHAELAIEMATLALDTPVDDDVRRRALLTALHLSGTAEPGPAQRQASALVERAMAVATAAADRAPVLAAASLVHSLNGEAERCRKLFGEATGLLPADDPLTAALVLPFAYLALGHVDDLDARADAAERLTTVAAMLGDPVVAFEAEHLTFSVSLARGDGATARATQERVRALWDRVGDAGRRWSITYQEATVAQLDGRTDDAERLAEQAMAIGARFAPTRALAAYSGQLLELRRTAGRWDELRPLLDQLIDQQEVLPAWKAAGAAVFAGVDPARSRALHDELVADDLRALPRDFTWLAGLVTLARAAVLRGDEEAATCLTERLLPYRHLVCWQGTCTYGPVATVLAQLATLLGDHAAARTHAEAGLTLARTLQSVHDIAEAEQTLAAVGG